METLKLILVPLLLLAAFLLGIPLFGLWTDIDFESVLEANRDDDVIQNAQSVSTALSGQPELFRPPRAAAPEPAEPGEPAGHSEPPDAPEDSGSTAAPTQAPLPDEPSDPQTIELTTPLLLDGDLTDWQPLIDSSATFGAEHAIMPGQDSPEASLSFRHYAGMRNRYLYAAFDVQDDRVVYRDRNTLRLDRSDHLKINIDDGEGQRTYIVTGYESGWVNGFFIPEDPRQSALFESGIQGTWAQNEDGYRLEIRIRADLLGDNTSFVIADVDDPETGAVAALIGTVSEQEKTSAIDGTAVVSEAEISEQDGARDDLEPESPKRQEEVLIDTDAIAAVLGRHHKPPTRLRVIDRDLQVIAEIGELERYGSGTSRQPTGFDPEALAAVFSGEQTITRSFDGQGSGGVIAAAVPIVSAEEVVAAAVAEKTTDLLLFSVNHSYRDTVSPLVIAFFLGSAGLFLSALRLRHAAET